MKGLTKDIAASMMMGLILPGILLNFADMVWKKAEESVQMQQEETVVSEITSVDLPVKIRHADGTVTVGKMDDYLVGVVLKEMPAYFEEEALKAQSVVARTYAWKACETGGKHGDGSVCTEPSCCQAWISEEQYLRQGGTQADIEKIKLAVQSVSGQVLMYDGELIEATYFSSSGGRTESAVAVWGTDFPYLQAVDSPDKDEHNQLAVKFPQAELEARLEIQLTGAPENWVGQTTYTAGGGVDTMVIGGKYFTGLELRQKLNLRSTAFEVQAEADGMTFTTKGYGHRVGMSQYGADAMAVLGSSYEEILSHYYQGTELILLEEEK